MLAEPNPEPKSRLKTPLLYSSAVLVVGLLGVLFVMLSRWHEASVYEEQAKKERASQQHESDAAAVKQLGGKDFAILNFYASPPGIHLGNEAELCYGVSNATTVKLEPQENAVWPSASKCVEVTPRKTTTYTLTIEDAAGHKKTQSVEVKVY
jgi:hypothetical protein